MAGSLNKVTLIGNLGADPEVRTMGNGKKVATFSLATTENWTDKSTNERKESTEWHRIVVFNEVLLRVVEDYVKKDQSSISRAICRQESGRINQGKIGILQK